MILTLEWESPPYLQHTLTWAKWVFLVVLVITVGLHYVFSYCKQFVDDTAWKQPLLLPNWCIITNKCEEILLNLFINYTQLKTLLERELDWKCSICNGCPDTHCRLAINATDIMMELCIYLYIYEVEVGYKNKSNQTWKKSTFRGWKDGRAETVVIIVIISLYIIWVIML